MSTSREAFEAWFDGFGFDRAEYPVRYSAWEAAWQASRCEALEEAAKAAEAMRDLKEATRAQKAADEAISRDDKDDMLHRLRHCNTVSLFNGALERAAAAIRALAPSPDQGEGL